MCMDFCLQLCLHTTCVPGALEGPEKDTGFPGLELQTAVSPYVDAKS